MITVIFLLALGLAGWTVSTLMSKGKHQDDITKELGNIFESLKFLTSSITALVKLLMKESIASCLLYTSPSQRDATLESKPSSA